MKNTAKAFGVKALKSASDARVTGTEIDQDKVLKAARMVTGANDSEGESSDDGQVASAK